MKIYSLRVDSVHSEVYKVLIGINRTGRGEEAGKDPLAFANVFQSCTNLSVICLFK